ncbi:glycosyltransferase family 4 protein [Sporosarcina sp. FSL W8-0480]|uniref:glycosyltransferase family 4 protein n=1 Tax=Sporosarcina sp. FSL W8-0480 TaxID=2954701 RepID=UPI0030DD0C1E
MERNGGNLKKILILANATKGLYLFRRELLDRLLMEGYEVYIASPKHEKMSYFKQKGFKCIEVKMNRRGKNPLTDLKLFMSYLNILKDLKPFLVLTYTIKPNIYGGIACRMLRIPYIANITGLGTSIENKGLLQLISLYLYKVGLKKAKCVFFQNDKNLEVFKEKKIVLDKARLIPGSGVNLEQFPLEDYPPDSGKIKFLFIGRMMKSKGINELLKVAEMVKKSYSNVDFNFIGSCEESYYQLLMEYERKGILKYHGSQNDVRPFIKDSHAIINPSHHEGMSNVLLESASMGRPVIASNIPGCIETFDERVSGIGFEAMNAESMHKAIIHFLEMPYGEKKLMGIAGREKMENQFDRSIIINAYLSEIDKV